MVSQSIFEDVAVIRVENLPVNSVDASVAASLATAVAEANANSAVKSIVILGAGSTFIAGADIKMLEQVVAGKAALPDLLTFLHTIEQSPKPVIIAIHGSALGGGLETAMAGHYRVATSDAKLGQPEVKLGLIPGMGGTQRLPRLIGVARALEMCVLGEPVSARQAQEWGLIGRIIEGDLQTGALEFARSVVTSPRPLTSERACDPDPAAIEHWRDLAQKKKRGQHAPAQVIAAIEAATRMPFSEGLGYEQRLFRESLRSEQAAALIHVFLGERTVAKIPELSTSLKPRRIERAAVVGAGFMGSGIAIALASAGLPVLLRDVSQSALDKAMRTVEAKRPDALPLIRPQVSFDGFATADLVVEAVFENLEAKQEVFRQLADVTHPAAILATNTSTLDVDAIASASGRTSNCVGLHFFSPAHVMRLLEVVRGKDTGGEVIATAMALGKRLGKVAVLSRNAFGFIGNRMVMPYLRAAHSLLEEGASVEQINQVLFDFGMAMGPLAMEDLVGLDVTHAMRQEAQRRNQWPNAHSPLADRLYELNRLGQKTGAGWSRYDENRRASADPALEPILNRPPRAIPNDEILHRCLHALTTEGNRVLEEGIAQRPVDIDIVYVHGYGFPAWRGGPMFHSTSRK